METHQVTVSKTARVYTAGNKDANTVLLAVHGHGQLASSFLESLLPLANEDTFIIAPEALNRYYTGKNEFIEVAATWMTKEDRLNEINDYVNYLNEAYKTFELHLSTKRVVLLGFSQGVATASRWLRATPFKVHHFIVYAGALAAELENALPSVFSNIPIDLVYGENDPLLGNFLRPESIAAIFSNSDFRITTFSGKHEVNVGVLEKVILSRV